MKRTVWFTLVVWLIALTTGCAQQGATKAEAGKPRPVSASLIKEESRPVKLSYIGIVNSGEVKKYSFKYGGKLESVPVSKGEKFSKGQTLALLSTSDLQTAVDASELNVQKAGLAANDAKAVYSRLLQLFQAGAVAKNDLDKAKLDADVKEAQYDQANLDYAAKKNALADSRLVADMDGYVVDILFKQGEVLGAGYPVVIARGGDQVVNVGLSQQDVTKVRVGTTAKVLVDSVQGEGEISSIDQVPDKESRTYNAEVKLTKQLPVTQLGSTAKVTLEIGSEKGVWVPVTSVMNDGEDYVYVIDNGRAVRKNIRLLNNQGFEVKVEGLKVGDNLVTGGMKEIKEGAMVAIAQGAGTN